MGLFFQNDTDGMPTLKSIAQEATNRAGLKVPSSHANQQTQMQSIGTTAPTISQSGKQYCFVQLLSQMLTGSMYFLDEIIFFRHYWAELD